MKSPNTTRSRIRITGGGEVGSEKATGDPLRTQVAAGDDQAKSGILSDVPGWRATTDDDEHYVYAITL